jgi:transposase
MKIESIDIQATIEKAQLLMQDDKQLSAATKSMFEILILIITLLANRLNLNSTNSSKPPSSDPNRKKRYILKIKKNSFPEEAQKNIFFA